MDPIRNTRAESKALSSLKERKKRQEKPKIFPDGLSARRTPDPCSRIADSEAAFSCGRAVESMWT
jgi:hypothetical protein